MVDRYERYAEGIVMQHSVSLVRTNQRNRVHVAGTIDLLERPTLVQLPHSRCHTVGRGQRQLCQPSAKVVLDGSRCVLFGSAVGELHNSVELDRVDTLDVVNSRVY